MDLGPSPNKNSRFVCVVLYITFGDGHWTHLRILNEGILYWMEWKTVPEIEMVNNFC
jgi:hypothetical protein